MKNKYQQILKQEIKIKEDLLHFNNINNQQ